jgi:hypothetical protein
MKIKLVIGICLAVGVVVVAAWLYFNNPLVRLLAVIYGIGSEAVMWWVFYQQEKGQSDDPQTP